MAKQQNGRQRDELKAKTSEFNPRKLVETVVGADSEADNAPENSAQTTITAAADKGDTVVSKAGVEITPTTLSKQEADLITRKFANLKKDASLPLEDTIAEVKSHNEKLRAMKKDRVEHGSRIIRELRANDPPGQKTCKYCAHRVSIVEMDSKKELCEVCAS